MLGRGTRHGGRRGTTVCHHHQRRQLPLWSGDPGMGGSVEEAVHGLTLVPAPGDRLRRGGVRRVGCCSASLYDGDRLVGEVDDRRRPPDVGQPGLADHSARMGGEPSGGDDREVEVHRLARTGRVHQAHASDALDLARGGQAPVRRERHRAGPVHPGRLAVLAARRHQRHRRAVLAEVDDVGHGPPVGVGDEGQPVVVDPDRLDRGDTVAAGDLTLPDKPAGVVEPAHHHDRVVPRHRGVRPRDPGEARAVR